MHLHSAQHDHQHCIDDALARAERLCEERGVRFTPQRRRVLELVWSNHASAKAYDLLEALKSSDPSAKPATIYRALDFLMEQGFIHRVESLNAYVGCPEPEKHHERLLLICEGCHRVEERPAPAVMRIAAEEVAAAGFIPKRQAFEVHGLCADCAKD